MTGLGVEWECHGPQLQQLLGQPAAMHCAQEHLRGASAHASLRTWCTLISVLLGRAVAVLARTAVTRAAR